MANTSKIFLLTLLLTLVMACYMTKARPLHPSSSLVARLKLEDESANCWDSLIQLQSCSGEIILFFLNGETYLGQGCCQAIHTISQKCWPHMIDTLGFTTEEGEILEGYCDHGTIDDNYRTQSSPSPPAITVTAKVTAKTMTLNP